jgi:hypothetical protein
LRQILSAQTVLAVRCRVRPPRERLRSPRRFRRRSATAALYTFMASDNRLPDSQAVGRRSFTSMKRRPANGGAKLAEVAGADFAGRHGRNQPSARCLLVVWRDRNPQIQRSTALVRRAAKSGGEVNSVGKLRGMPRAIAKSVFPTPRRAVHDDDVAAVVEPMASGEFAR